MVSGGLAVTDDAEGVKRYRANTSHPLGPALRQLLEESRRPARSNTARPEPDATRRKLAFLGAPLLSEKDPPGPDESLEEVLLDACRAAHMDATVARVLPFVLARLADRLDVEALRRAARASDLKQTVGFMLELAGALGDRQDLEQQATRFLDRRRSRPRPFFPGESRFARVLAEERSPALARRWGWRMNMGLDSFAAVFDKFPDAAPHA